jgi:hypothetical protein
MGDMTSELNFRPFPSHARALFSLLLYSISSPPVAPFNSSTARFLEEPRLTAKGHPFFRSHLMGPEPEPTSVLRCGLTGKT